GQVTRSAADIYEEFFVPALFEEWAPRLCKAAALSHGNNVLDVACGTGVLAREAARSVQPGGKVTGLDRNEVMLTVARRVAPGIDWRAGRAEALPFPDGSFDAVVSQFGLMFFEDREGALKEMWRVLKPGGRLAVAVWDALEHSPGYADMVALLKRLFGDRIANELKAPFVLGDTKAFAALLESAGIAKAKIQTPQGTARFPSIESWVHTDVKGWTLADLIDDAQYRTLLKEAERDLKRYVKSDGTVSFAAPAHIATAVKG
ncbi:MAG TPA: methyltransferase domain-containing protein, partial [Verrucomicrobiae bacterium]|nr:methyltransferase domain-containing protein [Verrucomicrobiae bacterium]